MSENLKHTSELADELIENKYTLHPLGDHSFVRLVRYMGGDASVVQAARVSFGPGTKQLNTDLKLLKRLLKYQHGGPFEQVVMTFHMSLPIFVARQLVRHRTARLNEMSARYTPMKSKYWIPEFEDIRVQNKSGNKQGSNGGLKDTKENRELIERLKAMTQECDKLYNDLLLAGVAREQARTVLPVSLYTEWYYQMDLRNLLKLLKLRTEEGAQPETRAFAEAMKVFARAVAPHTMEYLFPTREV